MSSPLSSEPEDATAIRNVAMETIFTYWDEHPDFEEIRQRAQTIYEYYDFEEEE